MRRTFLALPFLVLSLLPGASFAQDAVFKDYDGLYQRMVSLMSTRQISKLMVDFGGADEMTPQQLSSLEARVQQIFPRDFETTELVRAVTLENGWRQEMHVFYTGLDYIYTYVLIHKRDGGTFAVNFRFNSSFDEIYAAF